MFKFTKFNVKLYKSTAATIYTKQMCTLCKCNLNLNKTNIVLVSKWLLIRFKFLKHKKLIVINGKHAF